MNPYAATSLPPMPSLAEQIMRAAEQMPRANKGGASSAGKLLTSAERIQALKMYADEVPVTRIARHFGVSEGQVRNCVVSP